LDQSALMTIFGTASTDPAPRRIEAGPLAVDLSEGSITGVWWHGAEVIRGIACPVRDRNWFTATAETREAELEHLPAGAIYRRHFTTADGAIDGRFTCEIHAEGRLRAHVTFRAERDVTVNRAGFVLLHPIAAEAGVALTVTQSDGTRRQTRLPRLISPDQPVRDIRALAYAVPAGRVEIVFEGDIFEMEDQRNWTDASFKTYCRPLSRPYPYDIPAGRIWDQSITLALSGGGATSARTARQAEALVLGRTGDASMPHVALAQEESWGKPPVAPPPGILIVLRTDLRAPGAAARAAAFAAAASGPVEIEAVLPDAAADADAALSQLRDALAATGTTPDSLTVLPAAYLASYQPEGPWPAGLDQVEARALALRHFAGLPVGTGVFSNFTELNRLPRRDPRPDFVTYSTTAIVHAADDRSVMQTLEALPQVHASAAALYPGAPIRLGLAGIGMRSNPYGSACAPNPRNIRRAGAMVDPRQTGLFGAAFMVGAVAATADLPVGRIVAGGLTGPFALLNADGGARPAWHVFRVLSGLSAARRRAVASPPGLAAIAATDASGTTRLVVANTGPSGREVTIPANAQIFVLDHHSAPACTDPAADLPLAAAADGRVTLGPYAVLVAAWSVGV
jgi:hypothetical protein